jgi:hypothetical protein
LSAGAGGGRILCAVLEPAVAIGQGEIGRGHFALGAVRGKDADRFEHTGDVGLMRPGVGPHGPADRARDGQPELEAGQAGPLRLGRRARHLDAGFRQFSRAQANAVQPRQGAQLRQIELAGARFRSQAANELPHREGELGNDGLQVRRGRTGGGHVRKISDRQLFLQVYLASLPADGVCRCGKLP